DDVTTISAIQIVDAVSAVQHIVATITVKPVRAIASLQRIVSCSAVQPVVAVVAVQRVVTSVAVQYVIAASPMESVVPLRTGNDLGACRATGSNATVVRKLVQTLKYLEIAAVDGAVPILGTSYIGCRVIDVDSIGILHRPG